jgi:type I restriction-modification system DNA methylase subunit
LRVKMKKSHLLAELEEISGQINFLNEFHKQNFDTGDFWQNRFGKKIKQQQRIDAAMLNDLVSTERALIHEFIQAVHEYSLSTYAFFGWLRKTFNGDLFPFQEHEQSLVDNQQLQVIRAFLSGIDMRSYSSAPDAILQKRFWPYKFNFIPIELISSIYEMFAHLRDSSAAEARSTHFTQFSLVELVLNIAMRDMPHTAKVLDPACGSGIFLVEAFRSLVWKRAREYGQPNRDELHDMLRSQIFGIDIDSDAVHVTAFSLYLTLLELDPDPQPLSALKFPSLLSAGTLVPNLYSQDFCNTEHVFNRNEPFMSKGFDIIIGNPPWTALKQRDAPRDPDNPQTGPQWGLQYCKDHDIPDNKPDQAFMIRASDFARPGTRIAFIVCSRLFYQQQDPLWLETYINNNT